jgi:8-oxo-dGTP pyrophosphatase MutT (NUDIX family)
MLDKKSTFGIFLYSIKMGKLLICKASGNYGGWSIPKGMAEDGESPIEAAVRELWEETGIDVNNLQISLIVELGPVLYRTRKKILKSFLYIIDDDLSDFDFKCISLVDGKYPEISDYKLVNLENAEKVLHESQASKIEEIKQLTLNI